MTVSTPKEKWYEHRITPEEDNYFAWGVVMGMILFIQFRWLFSLMGVSI